MQCKYKIPLIYFQMLHQDHKSEFISLDNHFEPKKITN